MMVSVQPPPCNTYGCCRHNCRVETKESKREREREKGFKQEAWLGLGEKKLITGCVFLGSEKKC